MFNKPKRLNKKRQAKNSHFESEQKGKAILMGSCLENEKHGRWYVRFVAETQADASPAKTKTAKRKSV